MRPVHLPCVVVVAACGFRVPAAADRPADAHDLQLDVVFMDTPSPLDAAPPGWWDPSFRWRIPLTIVNGSPTTMAAGFQVGLRLDLDASPCTGSREAIRIVWGTVELDRYVDELGATDEWTWFPLKASLPAGAMSTEYWLYCGNPTPSAAPKNPSVVFSLFDDFNGTTLGSAWAKQNSVTIANGYASIGGAGVVDSGILTNQTWPPGTAVDYQVSVTVPGSADFWAGFQSGFPDQPPWIQWWSQSPPGFRPDYASTPSDPSQFLGTNVVLDTTPQLFGVEYYGTSSMYRYADVIAEHHTHGTAATPAALNVRLHNHSSSNAVRYYMVRTRRAVDPPPSVTVGAAETY